ncbi:PAS domain-containing protein [Shimia sp. CNT1-13L.2]|uniref:PAS domain-containing protein n=1 Tax=Shimia sp. CNT1-13L.2 TaxID=2959663 RepID=UPI0020CCB604|nr:PAS domain-containing protein [Shimia sp. CNT1-13L.2]MCP9483222.1 PAS domain-containing protein [Shimia sp. CNT1-13L.2]
MTQENEQVGTEVDWGWTELIYSRTDARGVIRFANPTFCRVVGMEMDALRGAPHRIVRHADMPKGVFWIFWDRLKQGLPVAAFVKNRTMSGDYYWVFAFAKACEGGYLSVRFRPRGPLFETIRKEYEALRRAEREEGLSPEASGKRLLKRLEELGMEDFEAFMSAALAEQSAMRHKALGRVEQVRDRTVRELIGRVDKAQGIIDDMAVGFDRIRGEPINMRILSGRMDDGGMAISTISQNYDTMASEMWEDLAALGAIEGSDLQAMRHAFHQGHFALMIEEILGDAADALEQEAGAFDGDLAIAADVALLRDMVEEAESFARRKVLRIIQRCRLLPETCRRLRRKINGLDVVKLLCRVESGRMGERDTGLEGIIGRLDDFHSDVDRQLDGLSDCARQITSDGQALLLSSNSPHNPAPRA